MAAALPVHHEWTDADLDALGDAHAEVIHGVLIVSPSATPFHSDLLAAIRNVLVTQVPAGRWVYQEIDLRFGPGHARELLCPDLLIGSAALRRQDGPAYASPSDVDVVIELLSPRNRRAAMEDKRRAFAEAGIPSYWEIDVSTGVPRTAIYTEPDQNARDYLRRHDQLHVISVSTEDWTYKVPLSDLVAAQNQH